MQQRMTPQAFEKVVIEMCILDEQDRVCLFRRLAQGMPAHAILDDKLTQGVKILVRIIGRSEMNFHRRRGFDLGKTPGWPAKCTGRLDYL